MRSGQPAAAICWTKRSRRSHTRHWSPSPRHWRATGETVQDVEVGHLDVAPLVLRPLVSGDRLGSRTEEETQGERDQAGRESCAWRPPRGAGSREQPGTDRAGRGRSGVRSGSYRKTSCTVHRRWRRGPSRPSPVIPPSPRRPSLVAASSPGCRHRSMRLTARVLAS
jgi:hypothetical protein